jgi:voltage-gated potassium channel
MTTKQKIYEIIFEADTPAGKAFDITLIVAVLISVAAVMLETVDSLSSKYALLFVVQEWFFTVLFSVELVLRVYSAPKKLSYIFSFYGLVDIISILPKYLEMVFPAAGTLGVIRAFRILRIFRIMKLNRYIMASDTLLDALMSSKAKIIVFLGTVTIIVLIMGSLMYLIEGPAHGFTSIPKSVYWAIVTMTTVGYGDITPQTPIGQIISSILMITGYGVIAVPTGLVTSEMVGQKIKQNIKSIECVECGKDTHQVGAMYCSNCGHSLN